MSTTTTRSTPTRITPFLTCPGAKKQHAWYLSALVLGAVREKWGVEAPEVYVEPGCYTGAVGLWMMNRLGDEAETVTWRFSDPAPGVVDVWNWAMFAPEDLAQAVEASYFAFDDLWRREKGGEAKGGEAKGVNAKEPDFRYTEQQVEVFLELRKDLTEKLFGVDATSVESKPPSLPLEDAANFILFNHRCYNGTVRCGSGKAPTGDALINGRKMARCLTPPPGKYPMVPDGTDADRVRSWSSRPSRMEMGSGTYDEELARALVDAKAGKRVVVFLDPPHLKWETRKPPVESETDRQRRFETERRRAEAEAKGIRLKGRKPGKRESGIGSGGPEWVPAYTAYTPLGFTVRMKERLRDDVVKLADAGALVVVMDHWSAGWWWEETGVFAVLPGAGEEGDAAPLGQAGKGFYADVHSTTHFDMYTQVAAKGSMRAIRRDWFGVAGLRKGFHLPVREWVPRDGEDPWLRRRV